MTTETAAIMTGDAYSPRPVPETEKWTSVGHAALSEADFRFAKEVISNGEPFLHGVKFFFGSPMTAIYECRKQAVRQLGGTLSDGTVRKKELKKSVQMMESALMSPNFAIFELFTNGNIPTLVANKDLMVTTSGHQTCYFFEMAQCPFKPTGVFCEMFKLEMRRATFFQLCFYQVHKTRAKYS